MAGLMPYVSILTLATFLAGWEVAVRVLNTPAFLLPPPSAIFREVVVEWETLATHMMQTLKEISVGYSTSAVIAILLGVGIAMSRLLEKALMPLLIATDAIPKIAIAPLLLIWFGTGALSKVLLVGLVTFFPVLITTITGMQSADQNLVRMFRSVGASRRHEIFKLRLPYAVPYVFAGLKVATTLSVIGAVIAEWVSSSSGLGYLIISGITNFQTLLVFAAIFVLIAISLSFYSIVSLLGRKLSWRDATRPNTATEA